MGYSYARDPITNRLKLVCDRCGNYGGVIKLRCPFGYCPAIALCPTCRKLPEYRAKKRRELHRQAGCEKGQREFEELQKKEMAIIEAGGWLRTSALSHDNEQVKVIFRGKEGKKRAFWMSPETYDAYPLMRPTTPEDYAKVGEIRETENTNIYQNQ